MLITKELLLLCVIFSFSSNHVSSLCEQNFTVDIKRSAVSTGYHRILSSVVTLNGLSISKDSLLIVENLPTDIFVDPYQQPQQINEELKIFITHDVNVEIPSYQASPVSILLFSSSNNNFHEIILPLHFRYQMPVKCNSQGKNTIKVELENPSVFVRFDIFGDSTCESRRYPCYSKSKENCSWVLVDTIPNVSRLSFEVPVGCIEHFHVVFAVTFCGIGACTLILLSSLVRKLCSSVKYLPKLE